MRSPVYFAGRDTCAPTNLFVWRSSNFDPVAGKLLANVGRGNAPKSGEAGALYDERWVLVVLQQRRGEHSRRHRTVRSFSRLAIPVVSLDLQSQPGGEGQLDRRFHEVHLSSERILDRALCRMGLCLRLGRISEFEQRSGKCDA